LKFLCDNCKAKYQIADEKVAGKTVRMKCRKCGHQIEVRAAVTETSVSTSPPTAVGSGSDAPRPVAKNSLATSLSAAKPRAPVGQPHAAPAPSALAGAFQRTVHDAPQSMPFPHQGGGLELSVTDEWYVAINGVPVGPVRISELRRKAASGAVTEDSLCWQEGLEEWRPVRSIPELAAIVREAAQGNRPSLVSPPPNEGRASSPPRAPQRPAPTNPRGPEASRPGGMGSGSPFEPPRPMSPSRSNVVPLRVAASSSADEAPATPIGSPLTGSGAAAAFAPSFAPAPQYSPAPAPAFTPQFQPASRSSAPMAIADPFAVPGGPPMATASVLPPAPFAPSSPQIMVSQLPPQPRRGVPLWFWPILLFTGVFGVSAAVFVFRQQTPPAPVVIQMQPTAAATTTEAKSDMPPPVPDRTSGDAPAPSSTPSTGTAKVATGGPRVNTGGGAPPDKKTGIDLGGLVAGAGGPNVGGGGGPSPAGGGGGLDSSSVERVVASHRTGVKRTCWERGGADQKASVNVTVSATVAPDGSVAGTSSSGDDPVVAKCIESQVRSWRFSAPGATTTVNIPFKFVRQ
jgi:predicted Zn finger-like uncharacterized protein